MPKRTSRFKRARPTTRVLSLADAGIDLRGLALRQALPIALLVGLAVLLWDKINHLDMVHIRQGLGSLGWGQWVLALLCTAISFWALGRYDNVVHRLAGTNIAPREAEKTGMAAIALSQTIGMGVISSAFVRWRLLPGLSLVQAMRLSALVAISFLSAWAVVAAAVVVILPLIGSEALLATLPWAQSAAWLTLCTASAMIVISVFRPVLVRRLALPPIKAIGAFLLLTAIDTFAAGAALWAVLPQDCDINVLALIAAYLLALGVGLVSGTPGGMGGFEVTLLALLHDQAHEPIISAILAFRAIYYALPALIASAVVIRGPSVGRRASFHRNPARLVKPGTTPYLPAALAKAVARAPRAEAGLIRQGRLSVLSHAKLGPVAIAARSGQSLISLSDPLNKSVNAHVALNALSSCARSAFQSPFIYKCSAPLALAARRKNWAVMPIACEGWIDPASFTLNGSCRRQLRRKIRRADSAGVTVTYAGGDLPLEQMAQIAQHWADARGGERGFSMGTWDPELLAHSRVFVAHKDDRLLGFITLHANENEHTLDLLRPAADAPDGTMHALVAAAIRKSAEERIPRFSLAAVPVPVRPGDRLLTTWCRSIVENNSGAGGLRQFKSSFAPNWETLYAAAPTRTAFVFGMLDVLREIRPAYKSKPPRQREQASSRR